MALGYVEIIDRAMENLSNAIKRSLEKFLDEDMHLDKDGFPSIYSDIEECVDEIREVLKPPNRRE